MPFAFHVWPGGDFEPYGTSERVIVNTWGTDGKYAPVLVRGEQKELQR